MVLTVSSHRNDRLQTVPDYVKALLISGVFAVLIGISFAALEAPQKYILGGAFAIGMIGGLIRFADSYKRERTSRHDD
jgi:hypothetical membrane protein